MKRTPSHEQRKLITRRADRGDWIVLRALDRATALGSNPARDCFCFILCPSDTSELAYNRQNEKASTPAEDVEKSSVPPGTLLEKSANEQVGLRRGCSSDRHEPVYSHLGAHVGENLCSPHQYRVPASSRLSVAQNYSSQRWRMTKVLRTTALSSGDTLRPRRLSCMHSSSM